MNKILMIAAVLFLAHPAFAAVELDADSNGATDIGKGGTNATTAAAARTALSVPALSSIRWVTATAYTANNQSVTHGGHVFVCISSHTSSAAGAVGNEPGVGDSWATKWKYHGSDLYAAALGTDDNYVTDAEKTRIGQLEATDSVSFAGVTATGAGGLVSGVANVQQGSLTLYSNADIYPLGFLPAPIPTAAVTLKFPPAMPTADNSLLNFDINGVGDWTNPATLGGDNLGSATYSNVVALWTTCSAGYLKYDGTCSTPSGSMVYPGAGIPNSTGSAWGTSYTLDTDLSTTSASDDTLPSAKSVKALVDGLPTLTIQTSSITTGATNILGSDYGLIADTDGDGLPNKVDLAAAGIVQTDSSGVVSSSNALPAGTSLPQSATAAVDAAGETAVDTTSDQFVFYGAAKRVLSYKDSEKFVVKSPVDADDFLIGPFEQAVTVTNIKLVAVGGGSIAITPQICEDDSTTCSSLEAISADGGVDADDGSLTATAVEAGGFIKILSAAPSGTVSFLSGSIYYTITAD